MSQFNSVPVDLPDHNVFSLGNRLTTTLDFCRLQVAKVFEAVPTDVVNINLHGYVTGAPNPVPINGKISMGAWAFFVPTRLVCEDWNNYILGLSNSTLPYWTFSDMRSALATLKTTLGTREYTDALSILADMGYPSALADPAANTDLNSMRFNGNILRAFQKIWFDWFRDKQAISDANESSYCDKSMGNMSASQIMPLIYPKYRCWARDYVTSMFPAPSEGGIQSCVPTLSANGALTSNAAYRNDAALYPNATNNSATAVTAGVADSPVVTNGATLYNRGSNIRQTIETQGSASILHFNINQLRGANAYQRWLEHLLVSGKSVITRLRALFGASDTPVRLQMSEYIGGTETEFNWEKHSASTAANFTDPEDEINPTAFGYTDQSAQGEANILGQQSGSSNCTIELSNINYHAKEHGYIFIITCIMPVVQNYLGIDRTLVRGVQTLGNDRFDFFTHEFENTGFVPVLMQDVVVPTYNNSVTPTGGYRKYDPLKVIGYQQKYMDYKFAQDILGGQFVSQVDSRVNLKNFHLGRDLMREFGVSDVGGNSKGTESASLKWEDIVKPEYLTRTNGSTRTIYDGKFTITNDTLDHFIVNYKIDVTASRPMVNNAIPALSEAEAQGGHGKQMIPTNGVRI